MAHQCGQWLGLLTIRAYGQYYHLVNTVRLAINGAATGQSGLRSLSFGMMRPDSDHGRKCLLLLLLGAIKGWIGLHKTRTDG